MRGETVTRREIRAPKIAAPRRGAAINVGHVAEELLVPSDRAEQLGREFIFRLQVIREGVGIGEAGDLALDIPRCHRLPEPRHRIPRRNELLPHIAGVLESQQLPHGKYLSGKRERDTY